MSLRGHHMLGKQNDEQRQLPGFMVENIIEAENYYLKGVYLDAYRAIDALRLNEGLDCSVIGILGKGLGAAAAVFAAANSARVGALALETPSFCYLELGQNLSTGDMAEEINQYLAQHRNRKKQVKKNLSYYDALNFSDRVQVPVLLTVGFKDTISPPSCVFALFNHLLCDKTIEVYPEKGNEAGEESQYKKSLQWIKEILLEG
jgi:cephalosporin-C deacetylase-like acetyl esterase